MDMCYAMFTFAYFCLVNFTNKKNVLNVDSAFVYVYIFFMLITMLIIFIYNCNVLLNGLVIIFD